MHVGGNVFYSAVGESWKHDYEAQSFCGGLVLSTISSRFEFVLPTCCDKPKSEWHDGLRQLLDQTFIKRAVRALVEILDWQVLLLLLLLFLKHGA